MVALAGRAERDLWILGTIRVARSFSFGYVAFLLPLYLRHAGLTDAMIGLYALLATLSSALLTLASGYLGDLYSRKWTLMWVSLLPVGTYSIVLSGSRSVSLLMASSAFGLTLSPMGGGAGGGPVAPLQTAMVASRASGLRRTRIYSTLSSLSIVSALAGGAASSVVIRLMPRSYYHLLFLLALAIALGTTALVPLISDEPDRALRQPRAGVLPRRSARNVGKVSLAGMMGSLGLGMVLPLLPVYFRDVGASSLEVSLIYDASYALAAVAVLFAHRAEEALGRVRSVLVFRGLGTALLAPIPFIHSVPLAGAVYAMRTALYQMALPIRQSLTMDLYAPEERSRGLSISGVARRLPYGVAAQVGSILLQAGAYALLFSAAAAVGILDPVLYYVFFRGVEGGRS